MANCNNLRKYRQIRRQRGAHLPFSRRPGRQVLLYYLDDDSGGGRGREADDKGDGGRQTVMKVSGGKW